jgi:hypothetical protein
MSTAKLVKRKFDENFQMFESTFEIKVRYTKEAFDDMKEQFDMDLDTQVILLIENLL